MTEPQRPQTNAPQGPTPLVQMFPMHIGEPAAAPARPGTNAGSNAPERTPNPGDRPSHRAG